MTRRRGPRLPVRTRLTALIAVLVLGIGSALLAASYWLLTSRLPDAQVTATTGAVAVEIGGTAIDLQPVTIEASGSAVGPAVAPAVGPSGGFDPSRSAVGGLVVPPDEAALSRAVGAAVQATSQGYQDEIARRFATQSIALLAALTLLAVMVGWWTARRALAPVHTITATAHRLGAESLSERIPVTGPDDELRELGETFNEMLDRLQAAFDRERRLMANVSHELRTPLANQRIALEVGLEDAASAPREDLVGLARTALAQNARAERLIEQVLLLGRLDAEGRPAPADAVPVDVVAVVRALVAEPALLRSSADVRVEVQMDAEMDGEMDGGAPATAVVLGEPMLVERLVGNLLENAVRHNVPDGFARVRVETVAAQGVALTIENSGPVLDPAGVPSLFEPFRRGAGPGTGDRVRSQDGVGLGLSVVAAAARRLGVDVTAEPRATGGLVVRVTWPA